MHNKLPPQNLDSERALLGAILMAQITTHAIDWTIEEIQSIVCDDAFYTPQHKKIYRAIINVFESVEPIDYFAVTKRLDDSEDWSETLDQLADSYSDEANAMYYARCVRREFSKREIIRSCNKSLQQAYDTLIDPEDIIGELAKQLDAIGQMSVGDKQPVSESDLIKSIEHVSDKGSDRVPVALGRLGFILNGGLARGSLIVIGARPSCGKTSLGIGLAYHASRAANGCNSLFVSAEMTCQQVAERFLAIRTGMSVSSICSGVQDCDQFYMERNKAAIEAGSGRTNYIIDGITDLGIIVAQIKNAKRKHDIGLAVIDYLGLISVRGNFDRHDLMLASITRTLKTLAMADHIAIVLLVQLNRSAAQTGRKPQLSDLKDSGSIEADADVVMLIDPVGKNEATELARTDIIVAKQRQGTTGVASVLYNRETMNFTALELQAVAEADASSLCDAQK